MKRVLSVLLVMVCLMGYAAAEGVSDDINKMLTTLYWMYTFDNNLDVKYIDMAAAYLILEADTRMMEASSLLEISGMEDAYEARVAGWMGIIKYVSDMRLSYSNGEITRDVYAEKLFTVIKSNLDTAK